MTDTAKVLGYGGSAVIDGKQVLVTSGSFSDAITVSYLNMVSTPPTAGAQANRVKHADGTAAYSASLSFDVTVDSMGMFSTSALLRRAFEFDVGVDDGNVAFVMQKCKVSSLSLSGTAGGLVTASVSVTAPAAEAAGSVSNLFIRDDPSKGDLVGYWWTGAGSGLKAKSWTFSMNQEITSAYGNKNETKPLYLRIGQAEYALEVESYTPAFGDSDVVYIATSSFTLTGSTSETGFQFNGVTELGTYRYAFVSGSDTGKSDGVVIT